MMDSEGMTQLGRENTKLKAVIKAFGTESGEEDPMDAD